MPYYTFLYNDGKISIKIDDEELQVKRLKNQLLRSFNMINYDSMSILLYEKVTDTTYKLDDNEIVDSDMRFVLKIDQDIV